MYDAAMTRVSLRPAAPADLDALFAQQCDPLSNAMAGTKPHSREAFDSVWERIFSDSDVVARVIEEDAHVVGGISCFRRDGLDMIGYWIDRACWGRGIATRALTLLLAEVKSRPLHAVAARDRSPSRYASSYRPGSGS